MGILITLGILVLGVLLITLWSYYYHIRERLVMDICDLLEDCRKLSSWEDVRSELNLLSCAEGDEHELQRKSLRDLYRLREDMIKYYQIHREMRENQEFGTHQLRPQSFSEFLDREVLCGFRRARWK